MGQHAALNDAHNSLIISNDQKFEENHSEKLHELTNNIEFLNSQIVEKDVETEDLKKRIEDVSNEKVKAEESELTHKIEFLQSQLEEASSEKDSLSNELEKVIN